MIFLRVILIGFVVAAFSGCAARFSSASAEQFDSESRLFSNLKLSQSEKAQIAREFKKAAGEAKYIYEVFMEAPNRIQILTLDQRKMEYGSGRIYHFRKTLSGWSYDSDPGIDYWSVCLNGNDKKKSEQTGPANHRPFGTSGMASADPLRGQKPRQKRAVIPDRGRWEKICGT